MELFLIATQVFESLSYDNASKGMTDKTELAHRYLDPLVAHHLESTQVIEDELLHLLRQLLAKFFDP